MINDNKQRQKIKKDSTVRSSCQVLAITADGKEISENLLTALVSPYVINLDNISDVSEVKKGAVLDFYTSLVKSIKDNSLILTGKEISDSELNSIINNVYSPDFKST